MKKRILLFMLFFVALVPMTVYAHGITRQKLDISSLKLKNDIKNNGKITISNQIDLGKNFAKKAKAVSLKGTVADNLSDCYGFVVYDLAIRTRGVVNFSSETPDKRNLLCDYGLDDSNYAMCAGTMVDGEYWCYLYQVWAQGAYYIPIGLGVVDLETGIFNLKCSYADAYDYLFVDMAYDRVNKKIYAINSELDDNGSYTGKTALFQIDINSDGLPERVGTIDQLIFTLGADNGYLYGIANNAEMTNSCLYKVNTASLPDYDITAEAVGTGLGRKLYYSQTMEFDHNLHKILWFGQDDINGWFASIDPNTGEIISDTKVDNVQVLALSMPYQDVNDNAPSFVKELTAVADANGDLEMNLTWKNPSVNYILNELTKLTGVKIYRDGILVNTFSTTEVGATISWTDTSMKSGNHTYTLVPYNEYGDGLSKDITLFVGHDVPSAVSNLHLSATGTKGTISWTAPTKGVNGGWIDTSSMTYSVKRNPDNKVLVTSQTSLTLNDEVTDFKGYSYTVTPSTTDGKGKSATSNIVGYGVALNIPYINDLKTEEKFNMFSIIDGNHDGYTWKYISGDAENCASYDYCLNPVDDWFVSPPVKLDANKEYQVRYSYNHSQYKDTKEKFAVKLGDDLDLTSFTTLLQDYELPSTEGGVWRTGINKITPTENKDYRIGFYCHSDGDQGWMKVTNVSIREITSKDISMVSLAGSAIANQDHESIYVVKVANEGNKTVSDYTVQLIDSETKNVLATAPGVEVAANDTVNVQLKWTPTVIGKYKLQGNVVLDGDTYPYDNQCSDIVTVSVEDADAPQWLTIGTNESFFWGSPAYLRFSYSQTQTIYFASEINKPNVKFTGIRYEYSGNESLEDMTDLPMQVSVRNCTEDTLSGFTSEDLFTTVFDGNVDMNVTDGEALVEFKFDQPFEYDGTNFCVRVVHSGDIAEGNADWHTFVVPDDTNRSFRYSNNRYTYVPGDCDESVWESTCIPVLHISYTDNSGVKGVIDLNALTVNQHDNLITLSKTCDKVVLVGVSGATAFTGNDISKFSTLNITPGIYILKATCEGSNISTKLVIK